MRGIEYGDDRPGARARHARDSGVRRTGKRVGTSWCKRVDINTGSRHL
jgi:hypothetical protein